jgi:tetratricopeptide (TPR) repeat protein
MRGVSRRGQMTRLGRTMVALRGLIPSLRRPVRIVRSEDRDVEIRIRSSDQPDGSYPVWIEGPDDRRAEGRFRLPFSAEEIDRALAWMDEGTGAPAPARTFGERLFRALFDGPIGAIYVASQDGATPSRVRLTVDDPMLARIPWELLFDPVTDGALALRGPFVRGIDAEGGAKSLAVEPPLRVLIADSSPRDQPALESQLEAQGVEAELALLTGDGRIKVGTLPHATLSTLRNALREAAGADPPIPFHALHWIGHGNVDPVTGANVLMFEDRDGASDPIDGTELANVLHGSEIRLVLLNACHSAAPSPSVSPTLAQAPSAETTRGIAEVLLKSGIPAVVGMRVSVLDRTARLFASEFYAALADQSAIDDAVLDARRVVLGRSSSDAAEIGVPVIYLRAGDGVLLQRPARPSLWRGLLARFRRLPLAAKVGVVVLGVVVALVGAQSARSIYGAINQPSRMTGDFNVVVTEFDGRDASGQPVRSDIASELSTSLSRTLEQELANIESAVVAVRGPAEAGRLEGGASAEERALAARRLAEQVDADVVIYGWLDATRTTLQPEFYLRERALADAQELLGSFRLGSAISEPVPIDDEPAAAISVRQRLSSRARAISELVLGLSFFRLQRYGEAASHFDGAIGAEGWPDGDGKEILYLFRGSTAGALGKLTEAADWYDRALTLNPQFARARLGLAEVRFQEAKGTCERGDADAAGLREARDAFRATLSATDQPASANVSAKAHLSIARVDTCLSQAEIEDSWDEASAEAGTVVAAFEAGDDSLRQLAAEAHGVRAFSELPAVADPNAEAKFRTAEAEYRQAIALGSRQDRLAAYHAGLAYVLGRLGLLDDARHEYDEAIRLSPDAARPGYQRARDELGTKPGSSSVRVRVPPLIGFRARGWA